MSDQPTDPPTGPAGPPSGSQPSQPSGGYPPQGHGHTGHHQPGYPQQSGYQQPGYPPQGQGGYPQPGYGPGHPQGQGSTGSALTDLGFTRRITPALARTVYLAVIVLAALIAIEGVVHAVRLFIAAGDSFGGSASYVWEGLVALVKGPLTGFLLLALGRFGLEYFLDRASSSRAA